MAEIWYLKMTKLYHLIAHLFWILFFTTHVSASGFAFNSCYMRMALGQQSYDLMDQYNRVGPYQLTLKDLYKIGLCSGKNKILGVNNDWSQCDFKGFAAVDNGINSIEQLKQDSMQQDVYFRIILSMLRNQRSEIFDLENFETYLSYSGGQHILAAMAYKKGYKALQFYSLFKKDVRDVKSASLLTQAGELKNCQINNNVRASNTAVFKWINVELVKDPSLLEEFSWKTPYDDIKKKVDLALIKNKIDKMPYAQFLFSTSEAVSYSYDLIDLDLDGKDDLIVALDTEDFRLFDKSYYLIFYGDTDKPFKGFYASSLHYLGNRIVIDGYAHAW